MKTTIIAALAFGAGLAAARAASTPPARLGSSAVSWEQIEAGPVKGKGHAIFANPTATLDELEMHITRLQPGEVPHPPHTHPEEELVIIKEGTLEALQADKTHTVGPGGIIFQASGVRHGLKNVGKVPATYYVVRWRSPGMAKPAAPAAAK